MTQEWTRETVIAEFRRCLTIGGAMAHRSRRMESPRYVYFVKAGDAVKIGVSIDPQQRLAQLRTAAPGAELIAVAVGGFALERDLHALLSGDSIGGEWFRDSLQLRECIAALTASGGDASRLREYPA